jgi:hypothetical protein
MNDIRHPALVSTTSQPISVEIDEPSDFRQVVDAVR